MIVPAFLLLLLIFVWGGRSRSGYIGRVKLLYVFYEDFDHELPALFLSVMLRIWSEGGFAGRPNES